MTDSLKTVARLIARFRTWVLNLLLAFAFAAPEIFNSPEVLAVIPREWQRWFLVAAFLLNIWMRPRPAVLPSDPEVKIKKEVR